MFILLDMLMRMLLGSTLEKDTSVKRKTIFCGKS